MSISVKLQAAVCHTKLTDDKVSGIIQIRNTSQQSLDNVCTKILFHYMDMPVGYTYPDKASIKPGEVVHIHFEDVNLARKYDRYILTVECSGFNIELETVKADEELMGSAINKKMIETLKSLAIGAAVILLIFVPFACADRTDECIELGMSELDESSKNYAVDKRYIEKTCKESKSCSDAMVSNFKRAQRNLAGTGTIGGAFVVAHLESKSYGSCK